MTLKTIQSTALSILLHCVFIFGLVSFTLPHQKPKQEVKQQLIKSYLFFDSPPSVSEPVNKTADMEDKVVIQQAHNREKSAQPTNLEEIELEIDPVAKSSSGEKNSATRYNNELTFAQITDGCFSIFSKYRFERA
jgi:hypothetical protein